MSPEDYVPPLDDAAIAAAMDEMQAMAETASTDAPALPELNLTDYGNAQRFTRRHRDNVRFCFPWGKWLVWDGRRWRIDDTGAVMRLAKQTARSIWTELRDCPEQHRPVLAKWATRSESVERITATLKLAQSEPSSPIVPDELDSDDYLLNVLNGSLDLRTGILRKHDRRDLMTKLAPVNFDPAATAPTWARFLSRVTGNNVALIEFLQRLAGYSLTGNTGEQCLALLYGRGANGKSTLLEALRALLGDYAQKASFASFLAKPQDGIRNDLAALRGARLVLATEVEDGRRWSESLLKELTGGDTIRARFLYAEEFEFRPTFKLWFGVNHRPLVRGTDEGIWRRIRLVPFNVQIPDAERDRYLLDKLKAELPGILNWCLEGCLRWQRDGLGTPTEVMAATAQYRAAMDMLGEFIGQCCVLGPGCMAPATVLYDAFKSWCTLAGENAWTQRRFGERLAERGLVSGRSSVNGRTEWQGIGLLSSQELP